MITHFYKTPSILGKGNDNLSNISYSTLHNAGIALIANCLPKLLDELGYLNSDKTDFIDSDSKLKTIFVIENLVGTKNENFNDHYLILNRILCNYLIHETLPNYVELNNDEIEKTENFLNELHKRWSCMKQKKTDQLQEEFFQRTGYIEKKNKIWELYITQCYDDMLINTLPWHYELIELPWMEYKVKVKWICNYNLW